MVDQNPIGRSSRSNPATYVKAYDEIRAFYADQPLLKHEDINQASSVSMLKVAGVKSAKAKE
jgi:excinuclease ABC subunit A